MAQTKLSEMLNLPDADIDLVAPETTREDIRELKRFNNQPPEEVPEKEGSDIQNIIMEYFRPATGRPSGPLHALLMEVLEIVEGKLKDSVLTQEELIQEKINPKGNGTFRTGRYMLFLYDAAHGLKYKVFGETENHQLSYLSFAKTVHLIFKSQRIDESLDPWENVYGKEPEPEPEKTETSETKQKVSQSEPESKRNVDKTEREEKEKEKPESYPQETQETSKKAPAQLEEEDAKENSPESDENDYAKEEAFGSEEEGEEDNHNQNEGEWQQEPLKRQTETVPQKQRTESRQMEVEDYPEILPEEYIKCHDGSEIQETAASKLWKDIQSFINDLHTQISDREEPDLETGQKLNSGFNYLKMLMEDFIKAKEDFENE